MKKYIMVRCMLLCIAVVLLSGLLCAGILQYTKEQDILQNMKDILMAVSLQEERDGKEYDALAKDYTRLSFDYRITILNKNGDVLGDSASDPRTMENHAERPEVKQALAAGNGYEKRASETLGKSMIYVAMRDGDIIYRIAAPMDTVHATFLELLPALLGGLLLALLLTPFLAASAAKSITKPLSSAVDSLKALDSRSHYEIQLMPSQYDELQPIANTINTLTKHISQTVRQLSDQKEKTEYLLNNMLDGLILVDDGMRILQLNDAAQKFLNEAKNVEGKNLLLLTHQPHLIEAVQNALKQGTSAWFDLEGAEYGGLVLSVHVNAIRSEWLGAGKQNGAVILITDATQERRSEKMRRDFFANASHELKTPMTSILGFAELLAEGVVDDRETQHDYLLRIQNETKRMAALIEDILRLSRLESGQDSGKLREEIMLKNVVEEALASLQPQLELREIRVETNLDNSTLLALPQDMAALVQNLLGNAVKYNRPGGEVRVTLAKAGSVVRFSVADGGIGIPLEHQSRIFERFYRVDAGRSRASGGTGLGLAIVKHVVARYGGEILLQSAEGAGTVITVTFPAQSEKSI